MMFQGRYEIGRGALWGIYRTEDPTEKRPSWRVLESWVRKTWGEEYEVVPIQMGLTYRVMKACVSKAFEKGGGFMLTTGPLGRVLVVDDNGVPVMRGFFVVVTTRVGVVIGADGRTVRESLAEAVS